MNPSTLALSTVGTLLSSLLYLHIGNVLRQRKVSPGAHLANSMFVLWWLSLGGLGLVGVLINVAYMAGRLDVWLYQGFTSALLLVLFLALWGLQFYLMFLYTGSNRSFVPLGLFYGLLYFATMCLVWYIGAPEEIVDDGWSLKASPEVEFGPAFNIGFLLVIVGPQMLAAIAYARLYRKTHDPTQRYRIALVTGAILVWFGSSFIGTLAGATDALWWQLLSRVIGILGAVAILAAYKPPAFVRKRLHVSSIGDEPASA